MGGKSYHANTHTESDHRSDGNFRAHRDRNPGGAVHHLPQERRKPSAVLDRRGHVCALRTGAGTARIRVPHEDRVLDDGEQQHLATRHLRRLHGGSFRGNGSLCRDEDRAAQKARERL